MNTQTGHLRGWLRVSAGALACCWALGLLPLAAGTAGARGRGLIMPHFRARHFPRPRSGPAYRLQPGAPISWTPSYPSGAAASPAPTVLGYEIGPAVGAALDDYLASRQQAAANPCQIWSDGRHSIVISGGRPTSGCVQWTPADLPRQPREERDEPQRGREGQEHAREPELCASASPWRGPGPVGDCHHAPSSQAEQSRAAARLAGARQAEALVQRLYQQALQATTLREKEAIFVNVRAAQAEAARLRQAAGK